MVTIPVSVYQTVVTSMGQHAVLATAADNTQSAASQDLSAGGALTIADQEHLETKSETVGPVVQVMDMSQQQGPQKQSSAAQNGEVPDATQAVEVITVEPASWLWWSLGSLQAIMLYSETLKRRQWNYACGQWRHKSWHRSCKHNGVM